MSMANLKLGAAQLRTLVRGLLAAGATRNEVLDVVMDAASEAGEWPRIGDAAQRVVDQYSADIRDHNIKMHRELNRQKGANSEQEA
jgi:uncharacterized protein YgfB (UPF0149 family)